MDKESRGKRRLAHLMLMFLFGLTVGGFVHEQAWEMAKFYTPFIFTTVTLLYGLDAKFDSDYRLQRDRGGSSDRCPEERGREWSVSVSERSGGEDEFADYREQYDQRTEDR